METFVMPSPIGELELDVDGPVLVGLRFVDRPGLRPSDAPPPHASDPVAERLAAYFAGDLEALAAIPVRFEAGTPFQREVWAALRGIPVGETISYATLARRVGRPEAFRAVGAANGANPIAVVVPCHRVIAADGSLGGYGGGLERKRHLLAHEGAWSSQLALASERRV